MTRKQRRLSLIGAALGFVVGGSAREPVRETVNG